MEVPFIAKGSWLKGHAPSIAKAFLGRRFERCALAHCRRNHYRVLKRNWRVPGGEIDILARDRRGTLILIEVRGRSRKGWQVWEALGQAKVRRLKWLAQRLAREHRCPVRVKLVEVVGQPKGFTLGLEAYLPELFGFRLRAWWLE